MRFVTALLVFCCLLVTISLVSATAVDSSSLIGLWAGVWKTMGVGEYSGKLYITITRVEEGNVVIGRYEMVPSSGAFMEDFRGTFDGTQLIINGSFRSFTIVVG